VCIQLFSTTHRTRSSFGEAIDQGDLPLGLALDYCVKYSALDARQLGLTTYVILDGCRGIELEPGDIDRALEEMKQAGAILLKSSEL
jgi:nicotinamidase/pyrazinamidase